MRKIRYIAVDFDNTITKGGTFPEIGELRPHAKKTLRGWHERGFVLILWTCRTEEALEEALNFLKEHDIAFHWVNENPPELQEIHGNDPRKLGVDVVIDDRNWFIGGAETDPIDWALIAINAHHSWESLSLEEYLEQVK